MDIVSHALIGWIICLLAGAHVPQAFWIILFSVIADIVLIPAYIILGKNNKRFLWIAKNGDWHGLAEKHPFLATAYDITHSLFFAVVIIYPAVIVFGLPKLAFAAYLSHLAVDIFSHKKEWAIKIFYPFKFKINGFSDVWAWPVYFMAISWAVLLAMILLIK
ncbi:MAG TPA: hypothetical protein PLF16_00140 [Candidatus Staskawiczbacteria bacterium]|nr:hypothetical protein [Candidatus Staskawiczbacteria bacterium]